MQVSGEPAKSQQCEDRRPHVGRGHGRVRQHQRMKAPERGGRSPGNASEQLAAPLSDQPATGQVEENRDQPRAKEERVETVLIPLAKVPHHQVRSQVAFSQPTLVN